MFSAISAKNYKESVIFLKIPALPHSSRWTATRSHRPPLKLQRPLLEALMFLTAPTMEAKVHHIPRRRPRAKEDTGYFWCQVGRAGPGVRRLAVKGESISKGHHVGLRYLVQGPCCKCSLCSSNLNFIIWKVGAMLLLLVILTLCSYMIIEQDTTCVMCLQLHKY